MDYRLQYKTFAVFATATATPFPVKQSISLHHKEV